MLFNLIYKQFTWLHVYQITSVFSIEKYVIPLK